MDDKLFRVVPFRKGQEGRGYTYYAVMQVATGLYMTTRRKFSEADIYSLSVRIHESVNIAVGFAEALGYTLDTQSELLVRTSLNGVELSRIHNKLEGAFFILRGELVTQSGVTDYGVLTFNIPADVKVVGLLYLPGWVLCEEKAESRALTGRAWKFNKVWPQNCVNIH